MTEPTATTTIIVNPIAGGRNRAPKIAQELQQLFEANGQTAEINTTEQPGDATRFAVLAVAQQRKMVVAIGGDGTINEIGQGLVDTDVILGIIPCGSGNGLARTLQIPTDIPKAIRLLFEGEVVPIDTGKANDRFFLLIAGFGFDVVVGKSFEESNRRGPLPYFYLSLKEYFTYRPERLVIEANGESQVVTPFIVAVANGQQYGNNACIAPHAKLNDGLFDIYVVHQLKPANLPEAITKLFRRRIDKYSHVQSCRAPQVTIRRESRGYVNIDGEPVPEVADVEISILPKSLRLIAPPHNRGLVR